MKWLPIAIVLCFSVRCLAQGSATPDTLDPVGVEQRTDQGSPPIFNDWGVDLGWKVLGIVVPIEFYQGFLVKDNPIAKPSFGPAIHVWARKGRVIGTFSFGAFNFAAINTADKPTVYFYEAEIQYRLMRKNK